MIVSRWRLPSQVWGRWAVVCLLLVGSLLYTHHAYRYFLHDDEGAYAYAAWRVSEGEVPYRDFLTPQMPVFLYWGGLVVRCLGRSLIGLRTMTAGAMLLTVALLFALARELYGRRVALIACALFLAQADSFHNARFFRPEAYMLLFQVAGMYLLVLGERRDRLGYLAAAGACLGLSILTKLFGVLALGGCLLCLGYAWWREHRPFGLLVRQALALVAPAAVLWGGVALLFQGVSHHFVEATIGHHVMQGANLTVVETAAKGVRFLAQYAVAQPVALAVALLGMLWVFGSKSAVSVLPAAMVPTSLAFLTVSRELQLRHLAYLAPAIVVLAGLALDRLYRVVRRRLRLPSVAVGIPAGVLCLMIVAPWVQRDLVEMRLSEADSSRLSTLICELAPEGSLVMADFPGLNFLSGRKTTYWAAGLSTGAASSGQIRGAMLTEEIERLGVDTVVVAAEGTNCQMTALHDYPEFRRFLQSRFALVARYQCKTDPIALEFYTREDRMPLRPQISYHDELMLTGLHLAENQMVPGQSLVVDSRWQVLSPLGRDYHLVLEMADGSGHVWAEDWAPFVEYGLRLQQGFSPGTPFFTSQWEPGQVVIQGRQLAVPVGTPPGEYYLRARVVEPESGYTLPPARGVGAVAGYPALAMVHVLPGDGPVGVADLSLPVVLDRSVGDLRLLGSTGLPPLARAGSDLSLVLVWQARRAPDRDWLVEFVLRGESGAEQRWQRELVAGLPSSRWREGEAALGSYRLTLDRELPEGHYMLSFRLLDAQGQALGGEAPLTGVEVRPYLAMAAAQSLAPQRLDGVTFGGHIALLGYDLEAGAPVRLTLYWGCLEPMGLDYVVFVHLVDGQGNIQGQVDEMPDHWRAPTSAWQNGEGYVDAHEVSIATDAPEGDLHIVVGLYDPLTGQRLSLWQDGQPSGQDFLPLPVKVKVH